jgi:hypothetical protein
VLAIAVLELCWALLLTFKSSCDRLKNDQTRQARGASMPAVLCRLLVAWRTAVTPISPSGNDRLDVLDVDGVFACIFHAGACFADHDSVFSFADVYQHPRKGLLVPLVNEGAQGMRCGRVRRVAEHGVVVLGHANVPGALAVVSEVDGSQEDLSCGLRCLSLLKQQKARLGLLFAQHECGLLG